jgi:predicted nucleic-acid-binding protein
VRIAADTNVIVRYLTWDDPAQAAEAARVLEGADAVVLPLIVLCEAVWVLRRAYRHTPAEIASALRDLIAGATVETDRAAAEAGLRLLEAGGDFADGALLYDARRAGAERLVTFDRAFAERAGPEAVTLLS